MRGGAIPPALLSEPERVIARLSRSLPQIAFVEFLRWHSGRTVRPHAHEGLWQLDSFPSGGGVYEVDGKERRIRPDLVFLVRPGLRHGIVSSKADPLVNLTVKFAHRDADSGLPPAVLKLRDEESREAVGLLRQLISEAVLDTEERRFVASLRLAQLLAVLVRADRRNRLPDDTNPLVLSASRYMNEHLGETLSLDDVARAAGVAGEHLCRVFRRATGQTPFAFLRRIRVDRARELISGTDDRLGAIAAKCGFRSTRDLGRTFRKLTGSTPRAFLKEARRRGRSMHVPGKGTSEEE